MTAPLDWTYSLAEIGSGRSDERIATAAEREAVARALDIVAAPSLAARYDIRRRSGGQYELTGSLQGEAVQECVVTLAPVSQRIAEALDAEFWPKELTAQGEPGEVELSQARDIEPIEGDAIDVGRIVFETFAAALDPYPRAPDATFQWSDPAGELDSPFAALKELKDGER